MIGQRVKIARREKGFTQESFSEMLGISTEHLSRIETGAYRPSIQLIEKICSSLEITEEELMFGNKSDSKANAELLSKITCLSPEKQKAISIIIDLINE